MTYRIAKPKATRKSSKATTVGVKTFNLPTREEQKRFLQANLNKTYLKVGERVRWKKPRRNAKEGVVVGIQSNVEEITWTNGGTMPMNVIIEVDKTINGVTTTERVKTNVKKVIYIGEAA